MSLDHGKLGLHWVVLGRTSSVHRDFAKIHWIVRQLAWHGYFQSFAMRGMERLFSFLTTEVEDQPLPVHG